MKLIVWFVPEANALNYVLVNSVKVLRRNCIEFIELPSETTLNTAPAPYVLEDKLIELSTQGIGSMFMIKDGNVDRIAFVYDTSKIDVIIGTILEEAVSSKAIPQVSYV